MVRKRHKPEEIVAKLRQVDVLVSQGRSVADVIRSIGVTEVSSGTSCSTARSSTRSRRPRSSSRAGVGTTTRSARPRRSAPSRPPRRSCCGRLRNPSQLRRPPRPWRSGLSCTNIQPGPLHGGRPAVQRGHKPMIRANGPRTSAATMTATTSRNCPGYRPNADGRSTGPYRL
jgi:hypothetical protein